MPIPDKKDLRRFCELDGWEETEAVAPDHDRYRKKIDDGSILRTKVSHGRGPVCNDIALWTRIWRHQLRLESEDEFWKVLKTHTRVPRGQRIEQPTGESLDAWLFEFLVNVVGLSENEVLALSNDAAMELYFQQVGRQAS